MIRPGNFDNGVGRGRPTVVRLAGRQFAAIEPLAIYGEVRLAGSNYVMRVPDIGVLPPPGEYLGIVEADDLEPIESLLAVRSKPTRVEFPAVSRLAGTVRAIFEYGRVLGHMPYVQQTMEGRTP
jgi:hypothetical protein